MTRENKPNIPQGWDLASHKRWLSGDRGGAIQAVIAAYNAAGKNKPASLALQLAYYFFLINNYKAAATVLEKQYQKTPQDFQVVLNLAVSYSRLGQHRETVRMAREVLALRKDNVVAQDLLAASSYKLGNLKAASTAGSKALFLKDAAVKTPGGNWSLPDMTPEKFAGSRGKKNVISFSLWGDDPRYLRGAIRNLLLAPDFFPGWELRFYMDNTVPVDFVRLVRRLGGRVIVRVGDHSVRQKLCWRFNVANDATVGRFLVRDVDSVFSVREAMAVSEWMASDKWFHVIRDWWTHTDLILAGMWGGVAGVLPLLDKMLAEYQPRDVETPNVDQWFLRDKVWGYVRQSCLVHDRCFLAPDATRMPGPPPVGNRHIGQDESAVRGDEQIRFLEAWFEQCPSLAPKEESKAA